MKNIDVSLLGKSVVVHHRPHGPDGLKVASRGRFTAVCEGDDKGPVLVVHHGGGGTRVIPISTVTRIMGTS